jgi:hypothetical protein
MHGQMQVWLIFLAFVSVTGVGAVTKIGRQIDLWFHTAIW